MNLELQGQDNQITLPSQINRNKVYLNPAYTGSYETTILSLMHRSSWLGFGGTSAGRMFQNAELHAPLKKQSIAVGGLLRHVKEGGLNTNEVFFNYCHRIEFIEDNWLTLGIKFGAQFNSLDQNLKLQSQLDDPAFSSFENKTLPNAGFGIAFYNQQYFAGISVPYLLNSEMQADFSNYSFILTAGGNIELNSDISFMPLGVFVYNISLPITFQTQFNFSYRNKLMGGLGYRTSDALIFTLGYSLNKQISFNYSYDLGIGNVRSYSKGSHEIGLLYYIGYKVNTVSPIDF
jgi:type IX secretion system PorP/SprF family membrane protein